MAITLLRHAALPQEFQKCYIGHSDIEIDFNLFDVEKVIEINAKNYDLVFCSDLIRTQTTLELLGKSFLIDSRLKEVKFRDKFETMNFHEIEQHKDFDPKYLDDYLSWHDFICEESLDDFQTRVEDFLYHLPLKKDILICSHAGVIKMIYSILKNINYTTLDLEVGYLDTIIIK